MYHLNELYRNMISKNGIQVQNVKENFIVLILRSPSNFEILCMPRNLGSERRQRQREHLKKYNFILLGFLRDYFYSFKTVQSASFS